jgi:ethanolamine utilization protein EutA
MDIPHETLPREDEHPLWKSDHIALTSAGIDVGTATCQIVFCHLQLRRLGRELSTRYVVVGRETIYRSPVALTPFHDNGDIDAAALSDLVAADYAAAGLRPIEVDTGVVLLTGEAAGRTNARIIGDLLAAHGGRFVSVAAGHRLEAVLAAHGSGAVTRSRHTGQRVLNIDIGGGTTKFAVIDAGAIVATAALHIGGRLAAFDTDSRIIRLEPAGARFAAGCGYAWQIGAVVAPAEVEAVGAAMAEVIIAAAAGGTSTTADGLWLTTPLPRPADIAAVMFSGGVAEYLDDPTTSFRSDLGPTIGAALRIRAARLPVSVVPAAARIRATVMGAAEYTVQVSGNTIVAAPAAVLPLRNMRVVRPTLDLAGEIDEISVSTAIGSALAAAGVLDSDDEVALALDWSGDPSYSRLTALSGAVCSALAGRLAAGRILCLVFDEDIAQLIGAGIAERMGDAPGSGAIVVIDGISLSDLDYVDIGAVMPDSGSVTVTVKSLLFGR